MVRLGDLLQIKHGWPFKSERFSERLTGGPIVVAIGNFQYTGGFRFDSTKTKEYLGEYPEGYELSPGDVLLAMTCQTAGGEILGIPARVPADGRIYLHNQRLGRAQLRDPQRLDLNFFYWTCLWQKFNHHLFTTASGTKILHTSPGRIEAFRFPLPPLDEQRRISSILGALDDKIELNRRMNRTLEEMARAIFKSCFIDFDGHDDLVKSEIGLVPRAWKFGTLADLAELNPESWSMRTRPASISYLDLSNAKWGAIEAVTEFQAGDAPSRAQRILRPGDTIVGTVRPGNGSYTLVARSGLTGSTGFAVLRPKAPNSASMIYLAATRWENIDRLAHLADGGAYPAVRPEIVAATPAVIPSASALGDFAATVDPLLQRIATNRAESRTLADLRDTLLPKLISGELRPPESR